MKSGHRTLQSRRRCRCQGDSARKRKRASRRNRSITPVSWTVLSFRNFRATRRPSLASSLRRPIHAARAELADDPIVGNFIQVHLEWLKAIPDRQVMLAKQQLSVNRSEETRSGTFKWPRFPGPLCKKSINAPASPWGRSSLCARGTLKSWLSTSSLILRNLPSRLLLVG